MHMKGYGGQKIILCIQYGVIIVVSIHLRNWGPAMVSTVNRVMHALSLVLDAGMR